MGAFERFFTFEFYIRYLRQNHSEDLNNVHRLKTIIRKKFVKLDAVTELSQCRYKFPDEPDNTYPFDIELDDLVSWTLNGLQRSHIRLDNLHQGLYSGGLPSYEKLKELLLTPFNSLKKYVTPNQKNFAYRFSNLLNPNNIYSVFKWWCNHIDSKPNAINSGNRNIGIKSDPDGSWTNDMDFGLVPFSSPTVAFISDEDTYTIFNTNGNSIKIDEQELSNSLVFCVRIDRDLQGFQYALNNFLTSLRAEQSWWHLTQLKSGVSPGFELVDPAPNLKTKLILSNQYANILDKHNSIIKNLIGLMCFDEIESIKNVLANRSASKISEEAAANVSKRIEDFITRDAELIETNCEFVSKKIKKINEVVKLKQNRLKYAEKYQF